MRAVGVVLVVLALAVAAGCGGGGSSASSPSTASEQDAEALIAKVERGSDWAEATVALARFCVNQLRDGSGDPLAASEHVRRMIAIAREAPDEIYVESTYRQGLGDEASVLDACAPDLSRELDRAVATLD